MTPNDSRSALLRLRPDLIIRLQRSGSDRLWVVKDPVSLKYFHWTDEEYAIARMLDGATGLTDIQRQFEETFVPAQLPLERLHAFLGQLHALGLVLSDSPGQGELLFDRHRRVRRQAVGQQLLNLLAIRFRGIDPELFLNWLYPKCRWMFAPWMLAVYAMMILSAILLVAVEFDEFQRRLPTVATFLSPANILWLVVALGVVKIVHEFGHALTCKRFGGECHELGLMLLAFTPCLYCNVSDTWMLPNRWHRIAVTAAGICVELVLAAACAWLWWYSRPGLFNALCLNVMVLCSVSTLLFNGNPLMRFDGYYILSDLVAQPNLAHRSTVILRRTLARWFMGMELPEEWIRSDRHRGWLATYGAASLVYRVFIVFAILSFCYRVLQPHGLQVLAQILSGVVVVGVVWWPVAGAVSFCRNPLARRGIQCGRLLITSALLGLALLVLFWVPLPYRVAAPLVLQHEDSVRVYVAVSGRLIQSVRAGERVSRDQPLARLVDHDLDMQVASLIGQRNQQRIILKNLDARRVEDPDVGSQIPVAASALEDIENKLVARQHDQKRLVLSAPAEGMVIPPPNLRPADVPAGQLGIWQGTPLDERNLGSYLDTGTLFCLIGDPQRLEAVLVIHQADRPLLRNGQTVRLLLDSLPGEVLEGTISEIATSDVKVAPRELAAGDDLPVRDDPRGVPRPVSTSYHARVSLAQQHPALLAGGGGRAKIVADRQTLGQRIVRLWNRTFHLEL